MEDFSRRRAMSGGVDIIHVHWPERLMNWRVSTPMAWVRGVVVLAALAVAKARGARLVWTAHNIVPHDFAKPRSFRVFFSVFSVLLDLVIVMSPSAEARVRQSQRGLRTKRFEVVPHGHYRDWYPEPPSREAARKRHDLPVAGRVLATLGLIRPYKNTPKLVTAFRARADHPSDTLVVAGRVVGEGLEDELVAARDGCQSVYLVLRHLAEDEMGSLLAASDVVVLPYASPSVLNSGSAILALSFDRPVVVPDTPAMRDLRHSVGEEWVEVFEGGPDAAVSAAFELMGRPRARRPDLADLDWAVIGARCTAAYRSTIGHGTTR